MFLLLFNKFGVNLHACVLLFVFTFDFFFFKIFLWFFRVLPISYTTLFFMVYIYCLFFFPTLLFDRCFLLPLSTLFCTSFIFYLNRFLFLIALEYYWSLRHTYLSNLVHLIIWFRRNFSNFYLRLFNQYLSLYFKIFYIWHPFLKLSTIFIYLFLILFNSLLSLEFNSFLSLLFSLLFNQPFFFFLVCFL